MSLPASLLSRSPITGEVLAEIPAASPEEVAATMAQAAVAFEVWRAVPAPQRARLVAQWAKALAEHRDELAHTVTLEAGKITSEALGEVQEMIDICDFAVGLSRQLAGLTLPSERAEHHLIERWHPLGVVLVISAFNFPVAVYAWNAALALICGNAVVWKPSEKTPLCAAFVIDTIEVAVSRTRAEGIAVPDGLLGCLQGGAEVGAAAVAAPQVALVSATGSTAMGRRVAAACAPRFVRTLLELGGNAPLIVAPSADLDLALRAIVFGAVGTAGQRCTTLRRLIVHESIADGLIARLKAAYERLPVGDPRVAGTLVGPLIDQGALTRALMTLIAARADGGQVSGGEPVVVPGCEGGAFLRPALVEMPAQTALVRTETFAPILYALRYETFEQALALARDVPQGLSSALFSNDLRETERFLSAVGSDCGLANINCSTSGAEIGGAFGGEKDTGGGRESGSDAWKAYMRRQTQTVNWGSAMPLSQGVVFDV
jgi:aldehyde dehydrogenase (NAD+)